MKDIVLLIYLFATTFEFLLCTTLLFLFTSAYNQEYRTMLWRVGGAKGWNSDPRLRVYFYANYKEPPPVPTIWDEKYVKLHTRRKELIDL